MVSKSLRHWDTKLAYAEFAYNLAPSYATPHSCFEVCNDLNPLTSTDLSPTPQETKVCLWK